MLDVFGAEFTRKKKRKKKKFTLRNFGMFSEMASRHTMAIMRGRRADTNGHSGQRSTV